MKAAAMGFAAGLTLAAFGIGYAKGSPTTTSEVAEVGQHLLSEATCKEVTDAYEAVPNTTPEQALLILHLTTFQEGYAYGKRVSREQAVHEILGRCMDGPEQPFAGLHD